MKALESDIKIRGVETFTVKATCRTPLKFGVVVVEELPRYPSAGFLSQAYGFMEG